MSKYYFKNANFIQNFLFAGILKLESKEISLLLPTVTEY